MKSVKLILFLLLSFGALSQNDSIEKGLSKYVQLHGYIKDMQIFSFGDNLDDIINDNLIHNRLNLRVLPTKKLSLGFELRNRIFLGESVDNNPSYGDLVNIDQGLINMSFLVANEPSLVFLSQVDRLWIDWSSNKWEFRLGRQRINWGTNLYWNSNDIFNAYSLVDFDYEERQGSDAVRIQRHFKKNMSSIELAVKPSQNDSNWVGGLMYRFNKWQYDFQFLAGWWNTDYVAGIGWAGNIKYVGFKGEATYFVPDSGDEGTLSASVSADYIFKNKLFLLGGFLVNSQGSLQSTPIPQNLFGAPVSAKSLMPMKYSGLLSLSYPFSEIVSGNIVAIYSPGVNTAFFMPSIEISVAENWDVSLFGQSFWMETTKFQNLGNGVYIRLKGSF